MAINLTTPLYNKNAFALNDFWKAGVLNLLNNGGFTPGSPEWYEWKTISPTNKVSTYTNNARTYNPSWESNSVVSYDPNMGISDLQRSRKYANLNNRNLMIDLGDNIPPSLWGNDRIGRKLQDNINADGTIALNNLGRRSLRRIRKRLTGLNTFLRWVTLNAGYNTTDYGIPTSAQLRALTEITTEGTIPILEQPKYNFNGDFSGFIGSWGLRARDVYNNTKNSTVWGNIDADKNGTITADEFKNWQTQNGLEADAKLGKLTAAKMGVTDLSNYSWMNVPSGKSLLKELVATSATKVAPSNKTVDTESTTDTNTSRVNYTGEALDNLKKNLGVAKIPIKNNDINAAIALYKERNPGWNIDSGGNTYNDSKGYGFKGGVKHLRKNKAWLQKNTEGTKSLVKNPKTDFGNSSGLNWAMNAEPAIMMASGYHRDSNGVHHQRTSASDRLANSLSNIAITALGPAAEGLFLGNAAKGTALVTKSASTPVYNNLLTMLINMLKRVKSWGAKGLNPTKFEKFAQSYVQNPNKYPINNINDFNKYRKMFGFKYGGNITIKNK